MQTKRLIYICFLFCLSWNLQASPTTQKVAISFYSETVNVEYEKEIILSGLLILEDLALMEYYERMETTPYQSLLDNLQDHKSRFQLNDWLYYQLLKATVEQIYSREGPLKKEVSLWFLLTKSGYDTRLSYLEDELFIYAWSEDDIFETPMIMDQERKFVNLSSINRAQNSSNLLKLLLFRPGSTGKVFSFDLKTLPLLAAKIQRRDISFKVNERTFKMTLEVDENVYYIMKDYPALAEGAYFNVPLSSVAYSSLVPKLKFMTQDKSTTEALQILVAFTRTGFKYKDDKEVFGRSKPMIPEELLHYPFSDCEDRSALFYYLVKEILDLPMLIIAYPDHLSVAVASDQIEGLAFEYQGLQYFICDPTGPAESNIIGIPPTGYERIPFEVIPVKETSN